MGQSARGLGWAKRRVSKARHSSQSHSSSEEEGGSSDDAASFISLILSQGMHASSMTGDLVYGAPLW